MSEISDIIENSEFLIDSILEGKCIFFIGSGFYHKSEQVESKIKQTRLEKRLAKYLKNQEDKLGIRAYEDGWFHFKPEAVLRSEPRRLIKKFYNQPNIDAENLLQKLILLPNKLFLSLTPDIKILDALDTANIPAQFSYYLRNRGDKAPPIYNIKDTYSVVYNLLGYIDDHTSVILTYDDFYQYLKAIFANETMDEELKEYILDAEHFIFLGVPFDMWYVPLFMRILSDYHNIKEKTNYAVNLFLDDKIITHSKEQYTMTFVKDVSIKEFIDSLFNYFRDKKQLKSFDYNLLSNYLKANRFNDFFDHILEKNKILSDSAQGFITEIEVNAKKEEALVRARKKADLETKRKQISEHILFECENNLKKFKALQDEYLRILKVKMNKNDNVEARLMKLKEVLTESLNNLKQSFPNYTINE